jgi:hypothetical protein
MTKDSVDFTTAASRDVTRLTQRFAFLLAHFKADDSFNYTSKKANKRLCCKTTDFRATCDG